MTKQQDPVPSAGAGDAHAGAQLPPTPRFAGASTATLPPTIEGEHGPGRAPADPTSENPLHRLTRRRSSGSVTRSRRSTTRCAPTSASATSSTSAT